MSETKLYLGDCLDVLRRLPDASVDAVVTDPPAGIAFMGKEWDDFGDTRGPEYARRRSLRPTAKWQSPVSQHGFSDGSHKTPAPSIGSSTRNPVCGSCHKHKRGSVRHEACSCERPDFDSQEKWMETRRAFISWLTEIMRECLRVLKPGGHALVWSIPRTQHWTATAIEDAGFEIRDSIAHLFGTGFGGKGCSVGKAIDRAMGADATPWEGWNTTLAPAREDWILARKPLAKPTVAEQVLATGTGAINIDACRTEYPRVDFDRPTQQGRWPKNVLFGHTPECVRVGVAIVRGDDRASDDRQKGQRASGFVAVGADKGDSAPNGALHGDEEVEVWACTPACPVRQLDDQAGPHKSGMMRAGQQRKASKGGGGYGGGMPDEATASGTYGDRGGVSRFFPVFHYAAKAPPLERHRGCEDLLWRIDPNCPSGYILIDRAEYDRLGVEEEASKAVGERKRLRASGNVHATVKNLDLMRWLCRLITPPGGVVLDPFMGSGSTGVAASQEGFGFVGIEQDRCYLTIAARRIEEC